MSNNKIFLLDRKIQHIENQLLKCISDVSNLQKNNLLLTKKNKILENQIKILLNSPEDNITLSKNDLQKLRESLSIY